MFKEFSHPPRPLIERSARVYPHHCSSYRTVNDLLSLFFRRTNLSLRGFQKEPAIVELVGALAPGESTESFHANATAAIKSCIAECSTSRIPNNSHSLRCLKIDAAAPKSTK
jgi:hypothetical protein